MQVSAQMARRPQSWFANPSGSFAKTEKRAKKLVAWSEKGRKWMDFMVICLSETVGARIQLHLLVTSNTLPSLTNRQSMKKQPWVSMIWPMWHLTGVSSQSRRRKLSNYLSWLSGPRNVPGQTIWHFHFLKYRVTSNTNSSNNLNVDLLATYRLKTYISEWQKLTCFMLILSSVL